MRRLGPLLVAFLLLILSVSQVSAQSSYDEISGKINAIKHSIVTVTALENDGIITKAQADTAREKYIAEATKIAGKQLSLDEILAYPEPQYSQSAVQLTALQRFAGLITAANILWLIGILLAVGAFIYLAGDYVV